MEEKSKFVNASTLLERAEDMKNEICEDGVSKFSKILHEYEYKKLSTEDKKLFENFKIGFIRDSDNDNYYSVNDFIRIMENLEKHKDVGYFVTKLKKFKELATEHGNVIENNKGLFIHWLEWGSLYSIIKNRYKNNLLFEVIIEAIDTGDFIPNTRLFKEI